MAETQPAAVPDLPAAESLEAAATKKPKKRHPQRGKKHRVLGEGEGDYVIAQVIRGHGSIPDGALVPVPGESEDRPFLQFEAASHALRWIKNDTTERLGNGEVVIMKICEVMNLGVKQVVQKREIVFKKKVQVAGPTVESEDVEATKDE
jgi:hypothetical protein